MGKKLPIYLEALTSKPNITPWQVDQAEQVVRLYFQNFDATEKIAVEKTNSTLKFSESREFNQEEVLQNIKKWLRIKHFADKAKQSYLIWCRRFFQYCSECNERDRA